MVLQQSAITTSLCTARTCYLLLIHLAYFNTGFTTGCFLESLLCVRVHFAIELPLSRHLIVVAITEHLTTLLARVEYLPLRCRLRKVVHGDKAVHLHCQVAVHF